MSLPRPPSALTPSACLICATSLDPEKSHVVREMMFGWRESFSYYECGTCGALWLCPIPEDLGRFYPPSYRAHSASAAPSPPSLKESVKRFLRGQQSRRELGHRSLLGSAMKLRYGQTAVPEWMRMPALRVDIDSEILDVGCGNGALLFRLEHIGFRHLTGIDPYLPPGASDSKIRMIRGSVESLDPGRFDLIMLHHVLEHIRDPLTSLRRLWDLLSPQGFVLIRIPIVATFAWKHYGSDWAQLDAPRHLFLPSLTSMKILAKRSGFRLLETVFDSDAFQFYGSEQYRRGIALEDEQSVWHSPPNGPFTSEEMRNFQIQAQRLNGEANGDQACFLFRKEIARGR